MSNFPMGAKYDPEAPYNQSDNSITVEVLVSVTLSKPVKIKINDYECSKDMDEDGDVFAHYDYSDCDFKTAFENQYGTPEQLFEGWDVDDYEIMLN